MEKPKETQIDLIQTRGYEFLIKEQIENERTVIQTNYQKSNDQTKQQSKL